MTCSRLLLRLEEDRRVGDLGADVVADRARRPRTARTRPASPRPGTPRPTACGEHQQHDGREHVADRHAGLRPAGPEARDCAFGLCSATSRTAPPHSPPTAKPWMNRSATSSRGRPEPDLRVGRQAAHQEGRGADQEQAELQQLLAAVLVAEVAEDDAAEGARERSRRRRSTKAARMASSSLPLSAKNTLLNTSVAAVP